MEELALNYPVPHGTAPARGCSHLGVNRFTRMFDGPGAVHDDAVLEKLAAPGGLMDGSNEPLQENAVPAGYAFFGQFVDHDVTLDTGSRLDELNQDPRRLKSVRSVSLDLDCVYGFGMEASPHLFDASRPGYLLLGEGAAQRHDVPRNHQHRALIGDPRNDENLFVSQLQRAFLGFHNKLMDIHGDFEEARRSARLHYQWIVWNDWLRRVTDPTIWAFVNQVRSQHRWPFVMRPAADGELEMPVEFSVAAYRFGHSMVRSHYAVNAQHLDVELFDTALGTDGFTSVPAKLAVDWRYLFDGYGDGNTRFGAAIDHRFAAELMALPVRVVGEGTPAHAALPFRNLLRGRSLGLPSGQATARAMCDAGYEAAGYPRQAWQQTEFERLPGWADSALSQDDLQALKVSAPLFFYLTAEAALFHRGATLGPLGSAILLEVFGAMLKFCKTDSIWSGGPFTPEPSIDIADPDWGLTLGDVLRFVEDGGEAS